MKKNLLFCTLIAFTASVFSQITINRSHLAVPNQKVIQAYDTLPHVLAASGPNQTWDFTDLDADIVDSMRFAVQSWYPGYTNFPKANMALIYYDDESYINYMSINDSNMTFYGDYDVTSSSANNYEYRLVTFPSTYNTTFTSSNVFQGPAFELGFDPDSSGPLPFVDSIMISFQLTTKSTMDGWGTMKTPLGNFPALKQTARDIQSPTVKMFTNGMWVTVPQVLIDLLDLQIPTADTSYSVNFWTNNATVGFPLIQYTYVQGEASASNFIWLMANLSSSSITSSKLNNSAAYPNPVRESLTVICPVANAHLALFDMNGQMVMEQEVNGKSLVSVQHLANGLYMLQLTDSSNGKILSTQKISKQ